MIVIAHLSDIHIDDGQRSVDRARAVMDRLDRVSRDLDAVLVTGDIADHGRPDEYERARQVLTSRHPVLVCPGNHDVRRMFRQHLLGEPGSDAPVNQLFRGAGFAVAMCDSSVPGKDEGYLDDTTLEWLDRSLAELPGDEPVLVGFHHPPARLHERFIDSIRQFGADRLAGIARSRPNLTAFVCGHAHTPAATTFAGRPLLVAPGVVSTLRLPWERGADQDEVGEVVDLDEPPSLSFHVLDDTGRITTHHRCVVS